MKAQCATATVKWQLIFLLTSSLVLLAAVSHAQDADCAGKAVGHPCSDDGNECTLDECDGQGACLHLSVFPGTVCASDDNGCTIDECDAGGSCLHYAAGQGRACESDGNACTIGECDAGGSCVQHIVAQGTACESDGNACTRDECDSGGACQHYTLSEGTPCEEDGDSCTFDECDAGGNCTHQGSESCDPSCAGQDDFTKCEDDGNECTRDFCFQGTCTHNSLQDFTPCLDEPNECTRDFCFQGACTHNSLPDFTPCLDEPNECTRDFCFQGACTHNSLLPDFTPCFDEPNECTRDFCIEGACTHNSRPDFTPCLDEPDGCTRDFCTAGACGHEPIADCLLTPQPKSDQKCINGMNKNAAKLSKAQGKENAGCLKAGAKGDVDDAQACLGEDAKGKVEKAETKVSDAATKLCAITPGFGFGGSAAIRQDADGQRLLLASDVFGADLEAAVIDSSGGAAAKCQAALHTAIEKAADAKLKEFNKCKKTGLGDGSIASTTDLNDCLTQVGRQALDADTKVGKAVAKIADTRANLCGSGDMRSVFPGSCSGASGVRFDECIEAAVECRVCRMLKAADALSIDCDQFDNWREDGSCI